MYTPVSHIREAIADVHASAEALAAAVAVGLGVGKETCNISDDIANILIYLDFLKRKSA